MKILSNGPIRNYFKGQGMSDFLGDDFSKANETIAFSHAMLTESAVQKMQAELRKLRQFAELHEESLRTTRKNAAAPVCCWQCASGRFAPLSNCVANRNEP